MVFGVAESPPQYYGEEVEVVSKKSIPHNSSLIDSNFIVGLLIAMVILLTSSCSTRALFLKTEPSEASIYVNDKLIGKTPIRIEALTEEVKAEARGYNALTNKLNNPVRIKAVLPGHEAIAWDIDQLLQVNGLVINAARLPRSEKVALREAKVKSGSSKTKEILSPLSSITSGNKIRLAVMELESLGGVDESLVEIMTNTLKDELHAAGEYSIISREEIEALANRLALQQKSGNCTSDECLADMGKALGTKLMVYGSISKVGSTFSISLRLLDTDNKEAIRRVNERCKCSEEGLFDSIKVAAAKLMGQEN